MFHKFSTDGGKRLKFSTVYLQQSLVKMVRMPVKKLWKTQFHAQQYPDWVNFQSECLMRAVHVNAYSTGI